MVAGSFACRNDVGVQIPDRTALQGGRVLARGRGRGGRRDRVELGFVHAVFLAPAALPGARDPKRGGIITVMPMGGSVFHFSVYVAPLFPIRVVDFGGTLTRSSGIGRTIRVGNVKIVFHGVIGVPRPIRVAMRGEVPVVVSALVAVGAAKSRMTHTFVRVQRDQVGSAVAIPATSRKREVGQQTDLRVAILDVGERRLSIRIAITHLACPLG